MNREQIDAFLHNLELTADRDEGDWVMLGCPLAEWKPEHSGGVDTNPSFGIHVDDDGISFYNCFTCKSKGPVSDLAKQLGRYRDDKKLVDYGKRLERGQQTLIAEAAYREWGTKRTKDKASPHKPSIFLNERECFREYPSVFTEPRAIAYLRRRGIGFSACIALNLRYDPKQFRILFPVYHQRREAGRTLDEALVGFTGRSIRGNRYIKDRNSARRGSYPKIRDYKGLEKELHLLAKRNLRYVNEVGSLHAPRVRGRPHSVLQNDKGQTRRRRFVVLVEGLFGLARLETIAPDIPCAALLGSALTEGKYQRLIERGDAIYWLTDNDIAGRSCIFGKVDSSTGKHKFKTGALYKIGNKLPQFIMQWPALLEPIQRSDGTMRYFKEDPDELTRDDLLSMIQHAQIYVHRGA